MIYILEESVMNGTVTMSTIVTGVESDTFAGAVAVVKALPKFQSTWIHCDSPLAFKYTIPGGDFPVYGQMTPEPLRMLN